MALEMKKTKTFAQTYTKLSQFLKEKRSLGEFSFQNITSSSNFQINGAKEIFGPTNGTMNLFPNNREIEENVSTGEKLNSLNLFPMLSSSTTTTSQESTKNMADLQSEVPVTKEEPKATTARMTIFYGGKVVIFDDLPEDKAQEIMSFASQAMPISPSQTQTPNNTSESTQGAAVIQDQTGLSDLPMARRVSLRRFMEKRKDRIAANAPYPSQSSSLGNHEKNNLDQQQQDQKLELNLFQ